MTTGTGTRTGTKMTVTLVEAAITGMNTRRRFGDYDNHKNRNNDGCPRRRGRTFRPSSDLPDMSDTDSPYFCHNLIDLAAYVLHLTSDLWALGEKKEEAMRVVVAYMDSRSATATAAASKTGIGSVSEDLMYI